MPSTIGDFRTVLEVLYFASGIVLAIVAIHGIQQIRILKIDIHLRNERASKEKAIDFAERYESYALLDGLFYDEYKKNGLPRYEGPINDFSPKSIPVEFEENARKRFNLNSWIPALNRLDTVAAAFISGVADEQLGFQIFGRSFCMSVATKYDLLCLIRDGKSCLHYQSIVDLYQLWSPRLSKAELLQERNEIDSRIAQTIDKTIPPVGVEQ